MKRSENGRIILTTKEWETLWIERVRGGGKFLSIDFVHARSRSAFHNLKASGRIRYSQQRKRYVMTRKGGSE